LVKAHRKSRAGSGPSQRQLRVGEEIRHVLAELFAEGRLHDPALAEARITVTEVKVSPDLKNATAFVLPFGGGDAATLVQALNHAAPYLRGEIARELKLRFATPIRFLPDNSFDRAQRLEALFREPDVARDLTAPADKDQEGDDEGGER
jgi:ribosome-binding factor A